MTDLDLAYTPATVLARAIAGGKVGAIDVVENALARIEETHEALNAFCFVYRDEAREAARAADRAVRRSARLGPLHGVPIAFKDLTPTRGKRTTMGGSPLYENWVPDEDAPVVARLMAAGAIMVGKTTSSELGYSGFTRSGMWGASHNPWRHGSTPGGSSGGSGAAVGAGCVPLAEGSDGGGSVRIPASFCGTVGLKPSFGRIPMFKRDNVFDLYVHHGPLARTIDDAALFLSLAQGPHDADILSLPNPAPVPLPVRSARRPRLALCMDLGCYDVHPEVAAQVRAAAAALEEAGAYVEEVSLDWPPEMGDAFLAYYDTIHAAELEPVMATWGSRIDPAIAEAVRRGGKVGGVQLARVDIVRTAMWRSLQPILARCDALLCPTVSDPAPTNDVDDSAFDYRDDRDRLHGFMTWPFNMLAMLPALSVPAGWTADGMPVGLQIVGRRYDDARVLAIGRALERVRPWADRRPPL